MGLTGLLSKWLEEVLTHSTVIGRVWLTVLFFFRVLMLMVHNSIFAQKSLTSMVCNTKQPGCTESCHNTLFPVAPAQFWFAQIIFVSTPTVLYLAYVMHVTYRASKHPKNVRKCVMLCYFAQLLVKTILEVVFITLQFLFYDIFIGNHVKCGTPPCPFSVSCYMPHSNELNVISIYILVAACVSVALNVLEGLLLLKKLRRRQAEKPSVESANLVNVSGKHLENNLCNQVESCDPKQADAMKKCSY